MKVNTKQITDRINLKEAIERYTGGRFNRSGFINCPFHTDKTPSLSVKGERFHCFSCDRGGDMIDFVQDFFNLDFRTACKRISDDFNLGIQFDGRQEKRKEPADVWEKAISDLSSRRKEQIQNEISALLDDQYALGAEIYSITQKKPIDWGAVDRLEDEIERKQDEIRFLRAL